MKDSTMLTRQAEDKALNPPKPVTGPPKSAKLGLWVLIVFFLKKHWFMILVIQLFKKKKLFLLLLEIV